MDKDKSDKETGLPMNKGICFIDFYDHETAKKFIVYITQNSKTLLKSRPIIEFAIEDSRLMKKRNEQQEKRKVSDASETEKKKDKKEESKIELNQKKSSAQANILLIKQKLADKHVNKEEIK